MPVITRPVFYVSLAKLRDPIIFALSPVILPLPADVKCEENEPGNEHADEGKEGCLHSVVLGPN